nr:MAG TPA: hypothetical protein [Caudoviricetes sp.]
MSNTKPDENMTKTAEEAKAVKKEEKPAAKAPAKKEEKPAATKEKTDNSAVTKEPEKKVADTADKKPAVAEKKEQPKAAVREVKEVEENVTSYPFTVALTHPVATYRGPSLSFVGKHFGGTVKVVGESGEFYKVSFVRSELGMTTSYMLRQEVEKCRS